MFCCSLARAAHGRNTTRRRRCGSHQVVLCETRRLSFLDDCRSSSECNFEVLASSNLLWPKGNLSFVSTIQSYKPADFENIALTLLFQALKDTFSNKMLNSASFFAYFFCMLTLTSLLQHVLGLAVLNESSGCGNAYKPYIDGESRTFSIDSSGGTRQYNVHLPLQYNPNVKHALMISYHGGTKTMEEQEQLSQFSNHSINPHMIAVYPQGVNVSDEDPIPGRLSPNRMSKS